MVNRAQEHTETQASLFGAVEMKRNLALEKAEISAYIRDEIGKERRLFSTVADQGRASALEAGKNKIDAKSNAETAGRAAQDLELYDRLSVRAGALDDVLNGAAKELAEGRQNANDVKRRAYATARAALATAYQRGEAAGAQGTPALPATGAPAGRGPAEAAAAGASAAGPAGGGAQPGRGLGGGITKGSVVQLPDGRAGVVQYVTPSSVEPVRARVRLPDGTMKENVKLGDVRQVRSPRPDPNADWIGVDLDKTLAHYSDFKGSEVIGKPIAAMVERVKNILANGEEVDGKLVKDVRFFTARVADDKTGMARAAIEAWSLEHLGQALPVTNIKDPHMVKVYDDRAAEVEPNTGRVVNEPQNAVEGTGGGGGGTQPGKLAEGTVSAGPASGAPAAGTTPVDHGPAHGGAGEGAGIRGGITPDRLSGDAADVRGDQVGSIPAGVGGRRDQPSRLAGETAAQTQERLLTAGRFQRDLSQAEDRLSWENAAKAKIAPRDVAGAPVQVMNAAAYEAIRKIAFPEVHFPGVFLPKAAAASLVARLRSFESNVRQRPGKREAANALRDLALAVDQAREPDGSVALVRADAAESAVREELWHRWQTQNGLRDSEAMQEVAARPEFGEIGARLKELGYDQSPEEQAMELVAKALGGDPDMRWTRAQQGAVAEAALSALVDERGPAILDSLPPIDPAVDGAVEKAREYGRQTGRAGPEDRGVSRADEEGVRAPGRPEGRGALEGAGPKPAGKGGERGVSEAGAPQSKLDLFRRASAKRRPPGFEPLKGEAVPLPGMEGLIGEGEAARGQAEREAMEERLRSPMGSIEKKAGEIERNSPLFGGSGPQGSLFRREGEPAPVWFLKSAKLVDQKMRGPMPANAALRMLENNGVKQEELEWTGLGDLLRAKGTAAVKPEQLRETLAANDLHVEETLHRPATGIKQAIAEGRPLAERPARYGSYTLPGGENYHELLLTLPDRPSTPKFDPSKVEIKRHRSSVTQGSTSIMYDGKLLMNYGDDPELKPNGNYEQKPDAYWMERAKKIFERGDPRNSLESRSGAFRSGHWEEPNVIGHVRFNDRTGPNGEKLLHLEELQSDWHQKGRAQGYKEPVSREQLDAARTKTEATRTEANEALERLDWLGFDSPGEARGAIVAHDDWATRWDVRDQADIGPIEAWRQAHVNQVNLAAKAGSTTGVPDAPFKKTWPELLFKRMARYAAENGYDGISWTPGEQQAERYSLAKQIEELNTYTRADGTYDLVAKLDTGRKQEIGSSIPKEKLSDYVGKEMATKIVAREQPASGARGENREFVRPEATPEQERQWDALVADRRTIVDNMGRLRPGKTEQQRDAIEQKMDELHGEMVSGTMAAKDRWQTFSGLDLKVGGEGMKGFYDKILPDAANKIGKPFGASVASTEIDTAEPTSYSQTWGRPEHEPLKVPYLPVTAPMRESVMQEGQPLFKRQPPAKQPKPETTVTTGKHDTGKSLEDAIGELKALPAKPMKMGERVEAAADAGIRAVADSATAIKKAWGAVGGAAAGAWDAWAQPAPWNDYLENLGELRKAELKAAMAVDDYQKELKRVAPTEREREAMTVYSEANGDPQTLKRWAAGAPDLNEKPGGKRYARAFEDAQHLTRDQQRVADAHREYYNQQLKVLTDAGLLPAGASHYVMHMFTTDPETLAQLRAVTDYSELMGDPSFLKRRVYKSYFEAIANGENPRTLDAGKILSAYHDAFTKTFMTRAFVRSLLYGRDPDDGRPLAALEARNGWQIVDRNQPGETRILKQPERPENVQDYVRIPASQLRNFTWELSAADKEMLAPGYAKMDPADQAKLFGPDDPRFPVPEGKQLAMKGDVLIHPSYAGRVSDLVMRSWFDSPSDHLPVRVLKGGLKAVGKAGSAVKSVILYGSGFHQVQLGMHALDHFISPFRLESLKDLAKDPVVQAGVAHGLKLVEIDPEGVLSGLPGMGSYHRYLFRDWIPRLKAHSYRIIHARNLERHAKNMTRDEMALMSAAQTNAAFSGQDPAFFRHLAFMNNRTYKAAEHMLLFSPDFTKARAQFAAQGFSKFGSEQRLALLRGALLMYAGVRILNAALNHADGWRKGAHWDPADAFSVVTPKAWGPAWGGKSISIRSVYGDMAKLIADPKEWTYNRLNPVTLRPTIEFITGRDNFGRQESKEHFAKEYAKQMAPIPVQKVFTTTDEGLVESFFTSLGANMATYRTPLEKYAHNLRIQAIPDKPESEDKIDENRRNVQLVEKIRNGQADQTTLWNMVSAGTLTAREAAVINQRASMSDLQYDVLHMEDFNDALSVWNRADASEKNELKDIMERKSDRRLEEVGDNQAAARDLEARLDKAGVPHD